MTFLLFTVIVWVCLSIIVFILVFFSMLRVYLRMSLGFVDFWFFTFGFSKFWSVCMHFRVIYWWPRCEFRAVWFHIMVLIFYFIHQAIGRFVRFYEFHFLIVRSFSLRSLFFRYWFTRIGTYSVSGFCYLWVTLIVLYCLMELKKLYDNFWSCVYEDFPYREVLLSLKMVRVVFISLLGY